jgi:hypothetical protein
LKGFGSNCSNNSECRSGYCHDSSYCSDACCYNSNCNSGYKCLPVTNGDSHELRCLKQ